MKFAAILLVALFLSVPPLRAQDISTPLLAQFAYVANADVAVGVFPVHVSISPNRAHAYVTNAGSNSVSVIDTNAVSATVPVGVHPSMQPSFSPYRYKRAGHSAKITEPEARSQKQGATEDRIRG